jgi:hypothetical protein
MPNVTGSHGLPVTVTSRRVLALEHLLLRQLDREAAEPPDSAIVVECQPAGGEVLGDATENPDDHRLGQKREQPVGDQHRRAIRRNRFWPMLVLG